MFADHWVIALVIGQVCSVLLLTVALWTAIRILQKWDQQSGTELQLSLERRSYLTSTLIRYVLIYQIVSLFLFLFTANNHLPGLIRGAMCASGTLSVNPYGHMLLYIKIFAIPFYAVYLFLDYFDQSEAEYPLTPQKYWLILPVFITIILDLAVMLTYFAAIDPQVIATCCSISFSASSNWNNDFLAGGQWIKTALILFYIFAAMFITGLILIKKYQFVNLILALIFIPVSVYSLKYHFVKFIYGLPTHNCLFDIFWSRYFYIGYLLFGMLMVMLICMIFTNVYSLIKKKLKKNYDRLIMQFRYIALFCTLLFVLINSLFWLYWIFFRL